MVMPVQLCPVSNVGHLIFTHLFQSRFISNSNFQFNVNNSIIFSFSDPLTVDGGLFAALTQLGFPLGGK